MLNFAWRASARTALCLLGPSPWHPIHRLRSFTFCCLDSPVHTWGPSALASACRASCLGQVPRHLGQGCSHCVGFVALGPLARCSRDWETCAHPKSVQDHVCSQSLPYLNQTQNPTDAVWIVLQTCPLTAISPASGEVAGSSHPQAALAPGRREGYGPGVPAVVQGMQSGVCCSSAAAVPAPEQVLNSPRHCMPGRSAGQHRLCCHCLA